jgi:hypothetical protein
MSARSASYSKAMKKKAKRTGEPVTADELLAMSADEVHEWSQRKLAERIAHHERKLAEERAERGRPPD